MSFPALGWASTAKVERASDKLILLALADRHNTEHHLAYPSIDWLCDFSCLDRKTVIAALQRLQEAGHIIDSGKRVGKTKQIKAWALNMPNGPDIGMLMQPKGAVFPGKESQKRDTEPVKEPIDSRVFDEGWKPQPETVAKIQADEGLSAAEVEQERKMFVLTNLEKGTQLRNPEIAFRKWCARLKTLNHKPKPLPPRAAAPLATATRADLELRLTNLENLIPLYERMGKTFEIETEVKPKIREIRGHLANHQGD